MDSLNDYSESTRIRVKLVSFDEKGWTLRQLGWLKKRLDKVIHGQIVIVRGGHYFQPDGCNLLVLHDGQIEIIGREKLRKEDHD